MSTTTFQFESDLRLAFTRFLEMLQAAQQQGLDEVALESAIEDRLEQLDHQWTLLEQLASQGHTSQCCSLLDGSLQVWAEKEALQVVLQHLGTYVDPRDNGLRSAFWNKLVHKHRTLTAELFLHMERGQQERVRTQEEHERSWQLVASRSFEDQRHQQQQFQDAASQWMQGQHQLNQQWFQHERDMFIQYQQSNREWANVAMTGVQQAQLGMKQWFDFAAATHQTVHNWMTGTEQRQAAIVEQAVHKANMKKWVTRLTIMGLVLGGMLMLFGCAFFAMMHLY